MLYKSARACIKHAYHLLSAHTTFVKVDFDLNFEMTLNLPFYRVFLDCRNIV